MMPIKQKNESESVIKEFFAELSQLVYLKKYGINVNDIRDLEENHDFSKNLSRIIEQRNFNATQTLELFWGKFQAVDKTLSKEQWLKQIYHFCQFFSFPDTKPECK